MCKPLPVEKFQWTDDAELQGWGNIPCVLEVVLDYPKEHNNSHKDYPLAPERLEINKNEKLIPNLKNKKRYVVHHENLKFYENSELIVTKIHRRIKFEEKEWLRPYIELNTNLRAKVRNNFERELFKLMNNSVFGKTTQNIRNRVNIKLVSDKRKAEKFVAKPNFKHINFFDENLVSEQK